MKLRAYKRLIHTTTASSDALNATESYLCINNAKPYSASILNRNPLNADASWLVCKIPEDWTFVFESVLPISIDQVFSSNVLPGGKFRKKMEKCIAKTDKNRH